jgi:GGDEF domain-containing protein
MDSGRQLTAIKKNGDETKVQLGLSPLLIAKPRCTLVSFLDAKNHIINTASHDDPLTGLANRSLFDELSDTLRSLAIRNKVSITVMFVDLR